MAHYIVNSDSLPVRTNRTLKSRRLYEYLFGEVVTVTEVVDNWAKVELSNGEECGWVQTDSIAELSEQQYLEYMGMVQMKVEGTGLLVKVVDSYTTLLLPPCSVLPMYNFMTGTFVLGNVEYQILSPMYWNMNLAGKRERIYRAAMCFLNTPFVRNGRTNGGIDDLNLVCNALGVVFNSIPHTIDEITKFGYRLSFIEEATLGDVLLFSDASGEVSHCGIYMGNGRVLHASGKVKIDKVDHQGIYNPTLRRYSFQLAGIIAIE